MTQFDFKNCTNIWVNNLWDIGRDTSRKPVARIHFPQEDYVKGDGMQAKSDQDLMKGSLRLLDWFPY